MPEVVLTINNLPNALRQHFKRRIRDLEAAALEVAHRGVAEGVRLTNDDGLVHTGAYKRGWTVGSGPSVRNDVPYAAVIEHGRRPNRPGPPIAPIREWVRLKLGKTGDDLERTAWAIRNSIHKKGTPSGRRCRPRRSWTPPGTGWPRPCAPWWPSRPATGRSTPPGPTSTR